MSKFLGARVLHGTYVKTPGSDSVSCHPLESSSADILDYAIIDVEVNFEKYSRRKGLRLVGRVHSDASRHVLSLLTHTGTRFRYRVHGVPMPEKYKSNLD